MEITQFCNCNLGEELETLNQLDEVCQEMDLIEKSKLAFISGYFFSLSQIQKQAIKNLVKQKCQESTVP